MKRFLPLFLLLVFCWMAHAENDAVFLSRQDGSAHALSEDGWKLYTIRAYNSSPHTSNFELMSDLSSTEVGVITAAVVKASSSSTSDASGGVGAGTIEVWYVNSSHALATKTVYMNGQTSVNVDTAELVLSARVLEEGTSGQQGDIYIHNSGVASGVPTQEAKVYAKIPAANGSSSNGLFYVGTGDRAILHSIYVVSGGGGIAETHLYNQPDGDAEQMEICPPIYTENSAFYAVLDKPLASKEYIHLECIGESGVKVSAIMQIFVKE